ncbi:aldo/keto reductase [Thermanaeromonas sp. C210]|uniref:aldo/keto reductase n=1 Tax=Thermanaeromonas sp. C210 TaxID=2731925 RepID=UPI00155C4413|nr:aldo/keto reductase [Thermanaeromonas sp. C210]GFN23231.1 aldo/keto reductase [Thermanaeromonas sp. C210]
MRYVKLGRTDLYVSRLCLGTLPLGPLQAGLELAAGASLIRAALEQGINFIDTAESYGTYPYIRAALRGWTKPVVVATKSYAYTREGMAASLEKARRELDRDVIEVFLLHEQESALTIAGHREALEYLLEARARGLVRAVGLSTHAVAAVRAAAQLPEIDVIHPLLNVEGIGILDGTIQDMLEAVEGAARAGKGIYAMKALGGGHLIKKAREALDFVYQLPFVHSVAVGMQSEAEVLVNVAWSRGEEPPFDVLQVTRQKERRLHIEEWCTGCGRCTGYCPQGALRVNGWRVVVDRNKCLLCGYCAPACRDFCLKVI